VQYLVSPANETDQFCRAMARSAARNRSESIELIEGTAESIPLPDHSMDTVVTTWTMRSMADLPTALAEVRRVLKADGRLLFAEHGLSKEPHVVRLAESTYADLEASRRRVSSQSPYRSANRRGGISDY
jgi:ubiquinone/menaquinone biosynthesis C-methylase UbiE